MHACNDITMIFIIMSQIIQIPPNIQFLLVKNDQLMIIVDMTSTNYLVKWSMNVFEEIRKLLDIVVPLSILLGSCRANVKRENNISIDSE